MSIDIKKHDLSIESRYRPEIDGLRAFSVVAIIINHFNKEILPNGYLGVDIFFVISGFVITSSLYQRQCKNFNDFIIGFYERRIKRLVPALSFFVLITSIAICLFNQTPGLSLKTGITSLFGLSNIFLFQRSTDYFAQSTELNVFTHTWSLGVEEQFYILFPLLIWFSGFGRQTKNSTRNLLLIIGALTIASLVAFLYLYQTNQPAAYFLMPTRFWEIASGCLLFIGFQKSKSIEKFLEKVPPILVLALIIGVMYLPISSETTSTVAVVVLSLILIASLKKGTASYKFFSNFRVVYIGLISYSLYLWHWGVLSISRWTIGIHWWSLPFQVALIIGLANFSYQYIEKPLRKDNWFGKRWQTIIVGGGVIITLSGVLIALGEPLRGQLFAGKKVNTTTPNFLYGEKCLENMSNLSRCYLIKNNSKKTLWLVGDSHTERLGLAGEKVAYSIGMNLKLYSAPGTTFPPIKKYQKSKKGESLQFLDDMKLIKKELYKQIKVGDIILLSMRMPYHFGGTYYEFPPSDFVFSRKNGSFRSQEDYFNDWISSVTNFANIAQKRGAKIIIQTPTPEWEREKNKLCSNRNNQWFNSLNETDCQIKSKFFIDQEKGLYKHLFETLNRLASSHENIYLFDTYKIVCPEKICSFTKDGVDIYADDDHISSRWARDFLSPEISKFINAIQTMKK
ncbi:acyltransferase [Prochlorococcus sp. AH-736-E20]|nr:acyltransferase [Prochlorococcus sp. AH-736-E20]